MIKAAVRTFVGHVRAECPGVRYASQQNPGNERSFVPLIQIDDPATPGDLQGRDWFGTFGKTLGPACVEGPSVAKFGLVAST
ncbi:MAG: hypothetical protein ACI9WU_002141 [Myxococcota bacterium]